MVGTLPPRCLQALPHGTKNAQRMDLDPDLEGDADYAPGQHMEPHTGGWMSDNCPFLRKGRSIFS